MLNNREIIHQLLALPDAPIILQEVEEKLEEERKRRLHFYNEITETEKAEFINGEVVIHSPVKKRHNEASGLLFKLLDTYVRKNKLGFVGYEKIMIQLSRNDYEPDICFFKQEKAAEFTDAQMFFPSPDLIVEVLSKSTAKNDRGVKFKDYQAHQVQEYWIIDPILQVVEQYLLDEKAQYELQLKSKEGSLESQAVKDFKIDIQAIFNEEKNLEELKRIMQ